MTVLRERPIDDQSSFGVSIWVQPASTHFWLTFKGAKALSAPVLVLYDDGVPFAWMTVLKRVNSQPGWTGLMADLPGAMLVQQVLPHLINGHNIVLAAADQRFSIPNDSFKTVVREEFQCAYTMQAMIKK